MRIEIERDRYGRPLIIPKAGGKQLLIQEQLQLLTV
jgi:hypothetical protein